MRDKSLSNFHGIRKGKILHQNIKSSKQLNVLCQDKIFRIRIILIRIYT
jgi:hypothetical protein